MVLATTMVPAGMDPDCSSNNRATTNNDNLRPDQISTIRTIQRSADALLPGGTAAPNAKRAATALQRCLVNWGISAEVLTALRPSGGSEKYFRKLQALSTRLPDFEKARDLLRAIVATRLSTIGRGISADPAVSLTDITVLLRNLDAEPPAPETPAPVPSSPANAAAEHQLGAEHRPEHQLGAEHRAEHQLRAEDEPSPRQVFSDDDDTGNHSSQSTNDNDDNDDNDWSLLDPASPFEARSPSPQPDQVVMVQEPTRSPSPPPVQVEHPSDSSRDPIEGGRKYPAASEWAIDEDSILQGVEIDRHHETLDIPRVPTPYPGSQLPLWILPGGVAVDRAGRRKRAHSAVQSLILHPAKKWKSDSHNKMDLAAADHDMKDDKQLTAPTCLSDPKGWLTGQCMADLLRVISAGCQGSVCVADTGGAVRHCMFERGGCLAAATRGATTILLPLHLSGNHWALAVLPLAEGESLELLDSLGSPAHTKHAEEQVSHFLRQLVALWPKDHPRKLPRTFRRVNPPLVAMAGLKQANTDDCGVAVVVVAMYIIAQKRIPQESHLGMWRRLLCFLAGESWPIAPQPSDSVALFGIDDSDCRMVRPDIQSLELIPQPPARGTLDDFEQYAQQLQRLVAERRDQQTESARKLEKTLGEMTSVLGTILNRWSTAPEKQDEADAAAEAYNRMVLGSAVASHALMEIQDLLVKD
ncbi:hypothetical protein QBC39DRAFT_436965 [Podospora conica]|nr:hypothetical protein QBC39DRAFT_436965 [Schizothecium conicum]